jgi:hypothetical protein
LKNSHHASPFHFNLVFNSLPHVEHPFEPQQFLLSLRRLLFVFFGNHLHSKCIILLPIYKGNESLYTFYLSINVVNLVIEKYPNSFTNVVSLS